MWEYHHLLHNSLVSTLRMRLVQWGWVDAYVHEGCACSMHSMHEIEVRTLLEFIACMYCHVPDLDYHARPKSKDITSVGI